MLELWMIEIVKSIGKFFLHPIFYWCILLMILVGYKRVKNERYNFGTKIYEYFSEMKHTVLISVVTSIFLSALSVMIGIVLPIEIVIALAITTILVSITGSLQFLSVAYTVVFSIMMIFVFIWIQPYIGINIIDIHNFSLPHLISLTIILAVLLLAEAVLLTVVKNKASYPALYLSERGYWIGQFTSKKLMFIPFFIFIPTSKLSDIIPFYPYFTIGEDAYSLLFIPFIIGFQYRIRRNLPSVVLNYLSKQMIFLSILVIIGAVVSLFYPFVSIITILLALLGKEWIAYRHKTFENKSTPYYHPLNEGVKVLDMLPNSPAERLGIKSGETILKVNDVTVKDSYEFYQSLQTSKTNYKLDVIDTEGEIRFVRGTFFEQDHYELGILFIEKPYKLKRE